MSSLINKFSWSSSRRSLLRECARKYYYHTYLKWGGWDRSAPERSRKAYFLSKMTQGSFLVGTLVHSAIEAAFKDHVVLRKPLEGDCSKYIEEVLQEWDKIIEFNSTASKEALKNTWSKDSIILREYYYDHPEKPGARERDKIQRILKRFFSSEYWLNLVSGPQLDVLVLDSESDRFKTVPIEGVDCYVLPDVVYRDSEGKVYVIDWKTGSQKPEDVDQATFYALAVSKLYDIPVENISINLVYLGNTSSRQYPEVSTILLDSKIVEHCKKSLLESAQLMLSYVEDREQNKPKDEKHFSTTESIEYCETCNFYEICEDSPLKQTKLELEIPTEKDPFFEL